MTLAGVRYFEQLSLQTLNHRTTQRLVWCTNVVRSGRCVSLVSAAYLDTSAYIAFGGRAIFPEMRMLWLCVIEFSYIYVSAKIESHSVNIMPQPGVTVTSAYFTRDGEFPAWVNHSFLNHRTLPHQKVVCSVAFIGACAPPEKQQEFSSLKWLPLDSNSSSGHAYISNHSKNIRAKCSYRSISQNWKKLERHFLLVFFCPMLSILSCNRIEALLHYSPDLLLHLKTLYDGSDHTLYWNNTFFLNSAPFITSRSYSHSSTKSGTDRHNDGDMKGQSHDVVVCAAKTYGGKATALSAVHRAMTWEWLHHYKSLKIAMRVYDRVGDSAGLFHSFQRTKEFGTILHYFNYTIASLLDPIYPFGRPWLDSAQQYIGPMRNTRLSDDDKVLTLTHCRFEVFALRGSADITVMVVDMDEFVISPVFAMTYPTQRKALMETLRWMNTFGYQEVRMLQKLPFLNNSQTNITSCLESVVQTSPRYASAKLWNRRDVSTSLLSCYGPVNHWQAQSAKSIVRGMVCPVLGYHNSCEDRGLLDEQDGNVLWNNINSIGLDTNRNDGGRSNLPRIYRYGCTCDIAKADEADAMLIVVHYSFYQYAYPTELQGYENETISSLINNDHFRTEVLELQLNGL